LRSCGLAWDKAASLGKEAVLADSGRAGEKSGLFEHPARHSPVVLDALTSRVLVCL